jgi:hypothetical protein
VAEEVEAEIKQVERELAEVERRARRGGAEARARELSAIRDILYEDKWFRVATAVYARLKRQFAEDGEAAEVIEAAERRLFGLWLKVVEAPLLKIEVAVDQDGKIAAVRCRVALDVGVGGLYGCGAGLQAGKDASGRKTVDAGAAEDVKRRGSGREGAGVERRGAAVRGDAVERLLEEVRGEFSGLPVYAGVGDYVKRTAPMDKRQFRRYLETCRWLGFRFDRGGQAAGGATAISSDVNLHQTPHRPPQAGHPSWTGWRMR